MTIYEKYIKRFISDFKKMGFKVVADKDDTETTMKRSDLDGDPLSVAFSPTVHIEGDFYITIRGTGADPHKSSSIMSSYIVSEATHSNPEKRYKYVVDRIRSVLDVNSAVMESALSFTEKRALQKAIATNLASLQTGNLSFTEKRKFQKEIQDAFAKLKEKLSIDETNVPSQIDQAYELGKQAFAEGIVRAPAQDGRLMAMIPPGQEVGTGDTQDIMKSWTRGWDEANLAAPQNQKLSDLIAGKYNNEKPEEFLRILKEIIEEINDIEPVKPPTISYIDANQDKVNAIMESALGEVFGKLWDKTTGFPPIPITGSTLANSIFEKSGNKGNNSYDTYLPKFTSEMKKLGLTIDAGDSDDKGTVFIGSFGGSKAIVDFMKSKSEQGDFWIKGKIGSEEFEYGTGNSPDSRYHVAISKISKLAEEKAK